MNMEKCCCETRQHVLIHFSISIDLFVYLLMHSVTHGHTHIALFTFAMWGTRGGAYDPQIQTLARFLYNASSNQV